MKKDIHYNQVELYNKLILKGYNFFTGVPDSSLKNFINKINKFQNIIATHEYYLVFV